MKKNHIGNRAEQSVAAALCKQETAAGVTLEASKKGVNTVHPLMDTFSLIFLEPSGVSGL